MAVDKLVDSTQLDADLTSVANAIRIKGGTSSQLAFPSGFVSAIGAIPSGGGGDPVYYTQYELTGDTTIRQFLDSANYEVHYTDFIIYVRANGTVAPTTGSYTINNYQWWFRNGSLVTGRHNYQNGLKTPDSFGDVANTNEGNTTASIQNGILKSNSTSTSCLGTTGDNVTIAEIPFNYAKYLGEV